jgi:LacI family gluconate utilization system Gnt-I transcriptional repressor
MRDVARAAGVSAITVSRTIASPDLVSEDTRKRVQAAIRSLRYVPNLAAGTLASSRSRIVAAVVPNMAHSVFAETLQGLSDVLRKADYHLLIGNSGYSLAEEQSLVTTFLARRPDGLVLTGHTHTQRTVQLIRAARIPVVEMWNLSGSPIDTIVGFSNFEAARAMTLFLGRKGYRRIGYIGGLTRDNDRTLQREAGYRAALKELKLKLSPALMLEVPFEYEAGADAIVELLRRDPAVDAVFAAGDVLAVGVLLECIRRGWKVPERLAVAGFDDARISSRIDPPLTTVAVPRYEIGRTAAQRILERAAGEPAGKRVIDLGFRIVERGST